ncbi:UDP-glucose/GDP-mannose dehydrogenase family protein, partial [Micrococcus sp. SIMBA_144]
DEQVSFTLDSFEDAVNGAHLVVILADHNEFKELDLKKLKAHMKTPVVFDTKNCSPLGEEVLTYRIGDLTNLKAIQE